MASTGDATITALLQALDDGQRDEQREQAAYDAVYPHLRAMAANLMRRERAGHTLQPTALVNEAYLRLVDQSELGLRSRTHFYAIAARIMRRVLVDHARKRASLKRGGDHERITLQDVLAIAPAEQDQLLDLISLDRSLEQLAEEHERMARVVEMRVFGGLTVPEVAAMLGVSERTAAGDWRFACMWLARAMAQEDQERATG
jgi:RNA polymerase sigma factor (TIGR02999 family)